MKRFRLLLGMAVLLVATPTRAPCAPVTGAGPNHPPVITAPATVPASEGANVKFEAVASDPDGDHVSLRALSLPVGATFVDGGNNTGMFAWTPAHGQEGIHEVILGGRDDSGLAAMPYTVAVDVAKVNRAPRADPGGPYSGVAGVPVAFDGAASADPDGDALTYAWQFGDGTTGTGPVVQHAYAATGAYEVALTVSDGLASDGAATATTIRDAFPARARISKANGTIRLGAGGTAWCAEIEPAEGSFVDTDVIPSTVTMKYGTGRISGQVGKEGPRMDEDADGASEIIACFSRADLRMLFAGLPVGRHAVTVTLECDLRAGGTLRTSLTIDVVRSGGRLAASLSPNPLNPAGTLGFVTGVAGHVNVSVFDPQGRPVRTLLDEPQLPPGFHSVRVGGPGAAGSRLASGVYFFRIDAPDGVETGRFVIMK